MVMAVMMRRALDTLSRVVEGFLCRETGVSYVLKPDTVSPTKQKPRIFAENARSGAFAFSQLRSSTPRSTPEVAISSTLLWGRGG